MGFGFCLTDIFDFMPMESNPVPVTLSVIIIFIFNYGIGSDLGYYMYV